MQKNRRDLFNLALEEFEIVAFGRSELHISAVCADQPADETANNVHDCDQYQVARCQFARRRTDKDVAGLDLRHSQIMFTDFINAD